MARFEILSTVTFTIILAVLTHQGSYEIIGFVYHYIFQNIGTYLPLVGKIEIYFKVENFEKRSSNMYIAKRKFGRTLDAFVSNDSFDRVLFHLI